MTVSAWPGSDMSVGDLRDDIEAARERFLAAADRFAPDAAARPIGPERWSPVEYVEHLVRAEEVTIWRIFLSVENERSGVDELRSPTPNVPIEDVIDRTWKPREEAPPLAVPELGGSLAYWCARLRRNAALVEALADLVEESDLDTMAYPHPISGLFTLRQGFQFIRFHLDRHREHLEEAAC